MCPAFQTLDTRHQEKSDESGQVDLNKSKKKKKIVAVESLEITSHSIKSIASCGDEVAAVLLKSLEFNLCNNGKEMENT